MQVTEKMKIKISPKDKVLNELQHSLCCLMCCILNVTYSHAKDVTELPSFHFKSKEKEKKIPQSFAVEEICCFAETVKQKRKKNKEKQN